MELEEVLEIFKYLATPFGETQKESSDGKKNTLINSAESVFQQITNYCLQHIDFLDSSRPLLLPPTDSKVSTSWDLTCVILSLLSKLKVAIEKAEARQSEEERTISVLSIQSQINVQKSIELVIGFGLVPYLLPGLGVPEKIRKMSPNVPYFLADASAVPQYEQFLRLSHVIEVLVDCGNEPSLFSLMVPKYTSDILAGFLQICKAPIARPKNDLGNGSLSVEQYDKVIEIRRKTESIMKNLFFQHVPKASLINSLFVIGATEKPRWISNSCSELLHEIILSKNGLVIVSTTMLDSSGRADTWKLMRVISNLMKGALVKSGRVKGRETVRNLSEQCLHLIKQNPEEESGEEHVIPEMSENISTDHRSNDKNRPLVSSCNLPYGTNVELLRIGMFCSMALMEIDSGLVKSAIWDRLFHHVLSLDKCQNNRKDIDGEINLQGACKSTEVTATTIHNVSLCVTYGELLLSVLKPMNVTFPVKVIQPVWSLFLQIFVACEGYLKKPVQEPKVSHVVEQLHHKLKDALILLFEIYASGSGQSLSLSFINGKSDASATQSRPIDLCDFCMTLVLNEDPLQNSPTALNRFDFECLVDGAEQISIIRVWRDTITASTNYNALYDGYLDPMCTCLSNSILKTEKLKSHWPALFRRLLSWGTTRRQAQEKKRFKSDEMPTHLSGNSSGGGDDDDAVVCLEDCRRFITFKLLGEMGEEDAILEEFGQCESPAETLSFLELLLNKFTSEAFSNSDDSFDSSQLIIYSLGIIGALVEAATAATATISSQPPINQSQSSTTISKEVNDMWDNLECFIPHLRKLTDSTRPSLVRQGIPNTASNLLRSIGTRGADNLFRKNKNELLRTRYQQAMEDAMSAMVHVKGHGLLELRRLIEEGDPETVKNEAQVLKVFHQNLTNEDSYVYLMSIQGMAALALKFHKKVVPVLIKEYDFDSSEIVGGEGENDKLDFAASKTQMYQKLGEEERIETRMKVGEILVKVVQKLGGLAPSYRAPLTNVFFRLMRDEEPLMRASALSNLGELCHLLKFSLGIVLTEVWYCVQSILFTEKNVNVRRAALHLIVLLLRGVEMELTAADILGDRTISEHLRDVRRFLTQTEQTEVDLIGKTHCQLALQELERIVRKLLTASTSLEFKIQVLNI